MGIEDLRAWIDISKARAKRRRQVSEDTAIVSLRFSKFAVALCILKMI